MVMEPLKFYEDCGEEKHRQNISDFLGAMISEAGVDADENRRTVAEHGKKVKAIEKMGSRLGWWKLLRGLCILLTAGCILIAVASVSEYASIGPAAIPVIAVGLAASVGFILLIVKVLSPKIKGMKGSIDALEAEAQRLLSDAEAQMAPLNSLFDDTDTFRLIEKTVPGFEFNKDYSVKMQEEFIRKNDFCDVMGSGSSVTDTVSGHYKGNPFLYGRYLTCRMGSKTYYGEMTITWVERVTASDGKIQVEHRQQTLRASVRKPIPLYSRKTYLYYGCQGAPNLSFSREPQHSERSSNAAISGKVKSGERMLRKKEKRALKRGESFTALSNSEFEVLFGANDRDKEVEFRMMYTPLAQINTVKLLRSRVGYGDDFSFTKRGRMNVICSEHSQKWDMDTSASRYYSHDIDKTVQAFTEHNVKFFKSLFFDFAPLLSVPLYQQRPVRSLEPPRLYPSNYTAYEYEVLANSLSPSLFAHPDAATDSILKATCISKGDRLDGVKVTASSFRKVERVDYVSVYGNDGNYHNVPVRWIDYIPVTKETLMGVRELGLNQRDFGRRLRANSDFNNNRLRARGTYIHGLLGYVPGSSESLSTLNEII